MQKTLSGIKVAILVTDGFEQVELIKPKEALEKAGATTAVVSPVPHKVRGWNHKEWGNSVSVDVPLESASAADFDALLLPGGVMNPDRLRMDNRAVTFVKQMFESNKPIAAICHGPWLLVEAGAVRDKTLTSWPSLKTDIINAGGKWVDQETMVSKNLLTSRKPDDIPAFNSKMIEEFAKSRQKSGAKSGSGA